MERKVMKYNPAFLTEQELADSFVVRHNELDSILQTIRENRRDSNQHLIVIGPRGSGKTTLVLKVISEIKKDNSLSTIWHPVVFPEESYSIASPGEFWHKALLHLSDSIKDERMRKSYDELNDEQKDDYLRERSLAQILDFSDKKNKRILFIIENFQMLLGDQISEKDAWALRHTFLHEPRIMILATATSRFDQIENEGMAMYDLFKKIILHPLDENECRALWTSITGIDPPDRRIRPLQILTGGNPRLMIIVSSFSSHLSFKQLMEDLLHLVDEHTEYFKTQLDNLPAMERKVYVALAELWEPSSARRIATGARINTNKTSSLLNRLESRGAVTVTDSKKGRKYYQVAERMYNIYYLMRSRSASSERVRAAVNFIIQMYEPRKIRDISLQIAKEACTLDSSSCLEHYLAYESLVSAKSIMKYREVILSSTPEEFFKSPSIPESLKKIYDELKKKKAETPDDIEKRIRKIVKSNPDSFGAWVLLGLLLHHQKHEYNEAEKAYRKALVLQPERGEIWLQLGDLLYNKFLRFQESEEALNNAHKIYQALAEKNPDTYLPHLATIQNNLGILYSNTGRFDDAKKTYITAFTTYQALAEKNPDAHLPDLAMTQNNLGALYYKTGRFEEAEQAYSIALKIYQDLSEKNPDAYLPDLAMTQNNLGILYYKTECFDDAEKAYKNALTIRKVLAEKNPDAYLPDLAIIQNNLGDLYFKTGRLREAEEWARKAILSNPGNASCQHTLAIILCYAGNLDESLEHANAYLQDVNTVSQTIDDAIALFTILTSRGYGKQSIKILQDSPSAKNLEPLIVGLRLYSGESEIDVKAPVEILEVGKDIVKRIQEKTIGIGSKINEMKK